ncbi:MAG: hypothetical protein EBU90_11835, partial [Proteobacteria bacterium]|nr:hypothetical protein [Pseudomonadota bacterium]
TEGAESVETEGAEGVETEGAEGVETKGVKSAETEGAEGVKIEVRVCLVRDDSVKDVDSPELVEGAVSEDSVKSGNLRKSRMSRRFGHSCLSMNII